MKYDIRVSTTLGDTYRANRVRSLFNVDPGQAAEHRVTVDLPHEAKPWRVGAIIGPSGTGKTTLGRRVLGEAAYLNGYTWAPDRAIVDEMGEGQPFDDVTAALSSVGLGSVPSWLRPYQVLSGGERFRADLERTLLDATGDMVLDEFTSVVDRQVAQIGAAAFAKAWRRKPSGRVIALAWHYDIVDWLQPDWLLDTSDWTFHWRSVQRPPRFDVDIYQTTWAAWPAFEVHHYLKLARMVAAYNYVGYVGDVPVAHVAVSTLSGMKAARLCRLVVMPEWQGAGVGMRFLETVAEMWLAGENPYSKRMTGILHTSHPGLIAACRRSPRWVITSSQMGGSDRTASNRSLKASSKLGKSAGGGGYGGHDRAVMGLRYVGDRT